MITQTQYENGAGIIVDTQLLVLYIVGSVRPERIAHFKRTRAYTRPDYELLRWVFGEHRQIYTVPHVMAEVSNLSDLPGDDRLTARKLLRELIRVCSEVNIDSLKAALGPLYETLGLTDAAIATVARERRIPVLTDDLDLYLRLGAVPGVEVFNFTHIRARRFDL